MLRSAARDPLLKRSYARLIQGQGPHQVKSQLTPTPEKEQSFGAITKRAVVISFLKEVMEVLFIFDDY